MGWWGQGFQAKTSDHAQPNAGTQPKKLNPTFQPTRARSRPTTPPHQPSPRSAEAASPPFPPRALPTIGCSSAWNYVPEAEKLPWCWVGAPHAHLAGPSQWESRPDRKRVGLAPAGSSGWGGGRGVSSCYTFCESGAHGRKRKQSRPTHPLTHECDYSTRFNRGLRTHKRKHTPIVFSTWRDAFKASPSRSHRSIFPDLFTSMQERQRKGCGGRTRVGNAKPTNYNAPKVRLWPFDQRERARLTRRRHI